MPKTYTDEQGNTVDAKVVEGIRGAAFTMMDRTAMAIGEIVELIRDVGGLAGGWSLDRETVYEVVEDVADEYAKGARPVDGEE